MRPLRQCLTRLARTRNEPMTFSMAFVVESWRSSFAGSPNHLTVNARERLAAHGVGARPNRAVEVSCRLATASVGQSAHPQAGRAYRQTALED